MTEQQQLKCRCGGIPEYDPSPSIQMFRCPACKAQAKSLEELTGSSGYVAEQLIERIKSIAQRNPNVNVVKVSPSAYEILTKYCEENAGEQHAKLHEVVGMVVRVDNALMSNSTFTFEHNPAIGGDAPPQVIEALPETSEVSEVEAAALRKMSGEADDGGSAPPPVASTRPPLPYHVDASAASPGPDVRILQSIATELSGIRDSLEKIAEHLKTARE